MPEFMDGPPPDYRAPLQEQAVAQSLHDILQHIRREEIRLRHHNLPIPVPFPLDNDEWRFLGHRLRQSANPPPANAGDVDRNLMAALFQTCKELNINLPANIQDYTPTLKPHYNQAVLDTLVRFIPFPVNTPEQARLVKTLKKAVEVLPLAQQERIFREVAHYSRYRYTLEEFVPDFITKIDKLKSQAAKRATSTTSTQTTFDQARQYRQDSTKFGSPESTIYNLSWLMQETAFKANQSGEAARRAHSDADALRQQVSQFIQQIYPPGSQPPTIDQAITVPHEVLDILAKTSDFLHDEADAQVSTQAKSAAGRLQDYQNLIKHIVGNAVDVLFTPIRSQLLKDDAYRRGQTYRLRQDKDTNLSIRRIRDWHELPSRLHRSLDLKKRIFQRELAEKLITAGIHNYARERSDMDHLQQGYPALEQAVGAPFHPDIHARLSRLSTPDPDTYDSLANLRDNFTNFLNTYNHSFDIIIHRNPDDTIDIQQSTIKPKREELRHQQLAFHIKPISVIAHAVTRAMATPAIIYDIEKDTSKHPLSHPRVQKNLTEHLDHLAAFNHKLKLAQALLVIPDIASPDPLNEDTLDPAFVKIFNYPIHRAGNVAPKLEAKIKSFKKTIIQGPAANRTAAALDLVDLYVSIELHRDNQQRRGPLYQKFI